MSTAVRDKDTKDCLHMDSKVWAVQSVVAFKASNFYTMQCLYSYILHNFMDEIFFGTANKSIVRGEQVSLESGQSSHS